MRQLAILSGAKFTESLRNECCTSHDGSAPGGCGIDCGTDPGTGNSRRKSAWHNPTRNGYSCSGNRSTDSRNCCSNAGHCGPSSGYRHTGNDTEYDQHADTGDNAYEPDSADDAYKPDSGNDAYQSDSANNS